MPRNSVYSSYLCVSSSRQEEHSYDYVGTGTHSTSIFLPCSPLSIKRAHTKTRDRSSSGDSNDRETKPRRKLMALDGESSPSPTLAPSFHPGRGCCERQSKSESLFFANIQKQYPLAVVGGRWRAGWRDLKCLMLIQIYNSKDANLLILRNTGCCSEPI